MPTRPARWYNSRMDTSQDRERKKRARLRRMKTAEFTADLLYRRERATDAGRLAFWAVFVGGGLGVNAYVSWQIAKVVRVIVRPEDPMRMQFSVFGVVFLFGLLMFAGLCGFIYGQLTKEH